MSSILIADDDEMLLKLLEHKLRTSGYTVQTVADGEKALDEIRQHKPDLVILDGMMPGIDGFEILRQIKSAADLKSTPVIMLSARSMEQDIVGCLSMGAADYMVKPFIPAELVARVSRVLGATSAA